MGRYNDLVFNYNMANTYSVTGTFRKLLHIIRREKKEVSQIYFFAMLGGLIQLSLPIGVQSVINYVLGGAFSTSLVILIAGVLLGIFFGGWVQISQMKIIEKVQQKLFTRYSFALASVFPATDAEATDTLHFPEQANRFFETIFIQKSIRKILLDIPAASIQIILGVLLLSFYHPAFILFGVLLLVMLFFTLKFTLNEGLRASLKESNFKYEVAGWLEELGRFQFVFRMHPASDLYFKKTDEAVTGYLKGRTAHFKILLFQYWSLIVFKIVITAALLIAGSVLLIQNKLNIGQFVAAEIVILFVINSVEKIISGMDVVFDVLTSVEKITGVIHLPGETSGKLEPLTNPEGMEIRFRDVNYSYPSGRPVLKDLNFTIHPGEKIFIAGTPMAGKSTLLKLLTGAYTSYHGFLSIDQISLRNLNSKTLRNHIGYLNEDYGIFRGTLLENLTLGTPGITVEEVVQHLHRCGLDEVLADLPGGLETPLSAESKLISKRTLRKLLLVRTLLGRPRLMLLDDPFHLATAADHPKIIQYITSYSQNATMLITGDSAEMARCCDRILFLNENGSCTFVSFQEWENLRKL